MKATADPSVSVSSVKTYKVQDFNKKQLSKLIKLFKPHAVEVDAVMQNVCACRSNNLRKKQRRGS